MDSVKVNQSIASNPLYSVWVSASAGSGKTKVLVDRLLRMLLNGIDLSKILCITFTNTGATEMRSRVYAKLAEWVKVNDDELERELGDLHETKDKKNIARNLFANVIDNSGDLKILTIHAFCQQIIKRFPLEASVVPNFQIADEIESRNLLQRARDAILNSNEINNDVKYIFQYINEEQFLDLLEEALGQKSNLLYLKNRFFSTTGVLEQIKKEFGVSVEPDTIFNDNEIVEYITQEGEIKKKKAEHKSFAIRQRAAEIFAYYQYKNNLKNFEYTKAFLNIVYRLFEKYDSIKDEMGYLDYNDLIFHTTKLLNTYRTGNKNQYSNWVSYKLDRGIEHILLDEAQDTSPAQWGIITAIADEFFAGIDDRNRTIFVVGDEKQSIFSFQGAEPKNFEKMSKHYQQSADNCEKVFKNVPLNTSFRSLPLVLEITDRVFADRKHNISRKDGLGRVEIFSLVSIKEMDEKPFDWTNYSQDSEITVKQRLSAAIVKEIKEWFEKGKKITRKDGDRHVMYGDIMILVKNRDNDFINHLVRQFNHYHIPVLGKDRFDLNDNIITKDILALCRFLLFKDDKLNLANLVKSPFLGMSEDDLLNLCTNGLTRLWQHNLLTDLLNKKDTMGVYGLLYYIFETRGMRDNFRQRFPHLADEVIDEFLNVANDYEANHNNATLLNFVNFIETTNLELKRDMEPSSNSVRIMTIHASKGMQAPIVFLPDTNHETATIERIKDLMFYQPLGGDYKLPILQIENKTEFIRRVKEQLKEMAREEYERLLYVAMTRAENELYICDHAIKKKSDPECWYNLLRCNVGGQNYYNENFEGESRFVGDEHVFVSQIENSKQDLNEACNDKKQKMQNNTIYEIVNPSVYYAEKPLDKPTDNSEILQNFYIEHSIEIDGKGCVAKIDYDSMLGKNLIYDLIDAQTGSVVAKSGDKITERTLSELKKGKFLTSAIGDVDVASLVLTEDLPSLNLSVGTLLSAESIESIRKSGIKCIKVVNPYRSEIGEYIYESCISSGDVAGTDTANVGGGKVVLENILATNQCNLSDVGRVMMNRRLGLSTDNKNTNLTKEDLLKTIYTLSKLKFNSGDGDDIDDLGNRRVKTLGELVGDQFEAGISRLRRAIVDRMNTYSSSEIDSIMPQNLLSFKLLVATINDFFATSQLSQFIDATNPLSELSHKRRVTSLGPGGLMRERAGFDVRDIHHTHYGRICPIETPEGASIGLVSNFALFAGVDRYGFITTPYKKVKNGVVTDGIHYLSAADEVGKVICGTVITDESGVNIPDRPITCILDGEFVRKRPNEIDYMCISSRQAISVSANLIPFIENDDAKRSLMASAMMRQAVPLVRPELPLVGTGLENTVALGCSSAVRAERDGVVSIVDSRRIVIEAANVTEGNCLSDFDVYKLRKFSKTNNDTVVNQRPSVSVGQEVKKGQILCNDQATDRGELSLGKNVLVAFLSWNGYNFADSIVVSSRLVRDEVFTSIHVEEFEITARDTRLGPEEITRNIPNMGEDRLRKLDESGIIHIGAHVEAGEILVGKTTPKSESPMTPEERLLRAVFGEKANDVKDASLYAPPSMTSGVVIDVRSFTREGLEKDERTTHLETKKIEELLNQKDELIHLFYTNLNSKIFALVEGLSLGKDIGNLKAGTKLTKVNLESLNKENVCKILVSEKSVMAEINNLVKEFEKKKVSVEKEVERRISRIREGENLTAGSLRVVKVFVASKQKLHAGDKMAGRHGNKGVVSVVLPMEDMPYMADGTPIDILLTPTGVPSRMSIGQVMETHLGWASVGLGKQISQILNLIEKKKDKATELRKYLFSIFDDEKEKEQLNSMTDSEIINLSEQYRKGVPFSTGVFKKVNINRIEEMMEKGGVNKTGKIVLYDGRSGEPFDRPVTTGYMYMLKLHHLVDTKVHARSVGPYSLVTQQPLGGRSHFGGQRFGEMECWALQGYGAAYTLQEMLTIKSDDLVGRVKAYEGIIQGSYSFACGIPESFNVMVKELRSLGLNIELIKNTKAK